MTRPLDLEIYFNILNMIIINNFIIGIFKYIFYKYFIRLYLFESLFNFKLNAYY